MPQRKTNFAPGEYYLIYNRGCAKNPLFKESENYLFALQLIKKYANEYHLSVIAYCLMPKHYHLLIRQNSATTVGKLAQSVFNSYAKAFNKRYNRSGTLFEGRYKSILIDQDAYLLHICRYIHANPVKASLVKKPEEWPFSNYLEWIGKRGGTLVDLNFVRKHFVDSVLYRSFVEEYLSGEEQFPKNINAYLLDD